MSDLAEYPVVKVAIVTCIGKELTFFSVIMDFFC